jgi:hypothetical protein
MLPKTQLTLEEVQQQFEQWRRHRKTLRGAQVGDIFMSLIHTCRLAKVNPFDYLVALQKHAKEVIKNPHSWLPWNYTAAVATLPT